jgi:hypothetical protein
MLRWCVKPDRLLGVGEHAIKAVVREIGREEVLLPHFAALFAPLRRTHGTVKAKLVLHSHGRRLVDGDFHNGTFWPCGALDEVPPFGLRS